MIVGIFEPSVVKEHKYAVAVPVEGGGVVPIRSYETLEQLREAYKTWQDFAVRSNVTRPYPIEFLDRSGKCRILTDLLQASE